MTQLKDIARVRVAGAPDNPGPGGLLEDQVLFIWSVAHAKLSVSGARAEAGGLVGPVNMGGLIRSAFSPAPKAKLDSLASDIRQVFKRSGTARCLDFSKGKDPVWWVSDEAPDNIVAVARWVATNNAGSAGGKLGVKMTKREEKLTAHEAGEDREPAPVSVKAAGALLNKRDQAAADFKARQSSLLEFMIEVGVGTGITARELAVCTGIQETAVRRALDALVADGYVFARDETPAEKEVRQRPGGLKVFGRAGTLYSAGRGAAKRTALPACVIESGIYAEPTRPAPKHVPPSKLSARQERLAREASVIAGVLCQLTGPPGKQMRPKPAGQLKKASDLTDRELKKVLRILERGGLIHFKSSRWGLEDEALRLLRKSGHGAVMERAYDITATSLLGRARLEAEAESTPEPEPAALTGVVQPLYGEDQIRAVADMLLRAHDTLMEQLWSGGSGSVEVLVEENNALKARVAELETSLAAVKRALSS
jgi:hypothetical protein